MFLNHIPLPLVIYFTKIPHVKIDICKPSNKQSSTSSPNVIETSCLNTRKQPSFTNICKPSSFVTKLSHLRARKSAHRKPFASQIVSFLMEISRQEWKFLL